MLFPERSVTLSQGPRSTSCKKRALERLPAASGHSGNFKPVTGGLPWTPEEEVGDEGAGVG